MISVDEALSLLSAHRITPTHETVSLETAFGRTLARPLYANRTQPPQAMSAMDGYAVRLEDVRSVGVSLNVIGEAPAGTPFDGSIGAGEAVRIFTGGVVPDGADHIVIQEDADRAGDTLLCREGYDAARHIRAAGIDFSAGDLLADQGAVLTAGLLSLAAAANHAELLVYRRPRVGILANGDELKPPGSPLKPGEIINSNRYALAPLIENWGGEATDLGIAGDSITSLRDHMESEPDIDIFVPVGGASVGDHDHVKPAFRDAGFDLAFEKIAVKPGKPTWFGQRGETRVLGLPGNPASALVCAHLFLKPLLRPDDTRSDCCASLTQPVSSNGRREQFLRAKVEWTSSGTLVATPYRNQDSSLLQPFATCNALIRRKPDAEALSAGDLITCILIGPVVSAGSPPS